MLFNSKSLLRLAQLLLIVFIYLITHCSCLHVNGIWSPSADPLKVIARFGVGKSDPHHKEDSYGYVFGNVTDHFGPKEKSRPTTSALNTNNVSKEGHNLCEPVFDIIDSQAYDQKCHIENQLDVIRYVPCIEGALCEGALKSSQIVQNYQFTYVIEDQKEPTFWFLLFIACHREIKASNDSSRNISCQWRDQSNDNSVLKYDVWLVNGHPSSASNKPLDFDHQFSFEQQDLLLYLLLILFYAILTIAQLYAFSSQKIRNLLTYLFTISLSMHSLSYFFVGLHKIVFAHDGQGFEILNTVADVIRILSLALFILFVMIIAKGWPVTKHEIKGKPLLLIAWMVYIAIEIVLFVWIKHSVNKIEEIDEYHTFPGWISLGFRVTLMMWFLYELRLSMMVESDQRRLKFYLHFGAGILVWFVHLPLVAMVALQIELMWRYKLISGFSSAADFLAYAIVTHLMWPNRQNHHFLTHQSDIDYTEELEYYDDSSLTHSESYHFTNANFRDSHSNHNHSNGFAFDNHIRSDIKT